MSTPTDTDRLAIIEKQLAALTAPPVAPTHTVPRNTGWRLKLEMAQDAARERRNAAAAAKAELARLQAERDAPAQAKRDAEIRAIDDQLARLQAERDQLNETRARLLAAPLAVTARQLARGTR